MLGLEWGIWYEHRVGVGVGVVFRVKVQACVGVVLGFYPSPFSSLVSPLDSKQQLFSFTTHATYIYRTIVFVWKNLSAK